MCLAAAMDGIAAPLREAILAIAGDLPGRPSVGHHDNQALSRAIRKALGTAPLPLSTRSSAKEPGSEVRLSCGLTVDWGPYVAWRIDEDGSVLPESGLVVVVENSVIPLDYTFAEFVYDLEGTFVEIR